MSKKPSKSKRKRVRAPSKKKIAEVVRKEIKRLKEWEKSNADKTNHGEAGIQETQSEIVMKEVEELKLVKKELEELMEKRNGRRSNRLPLLKVFLEILHIIFLALLVIHHYL
jgi:hypothetical protein